MHTPSRPARVLVLIALLAILSVAPGLAATAPSATPAPAPSQGTVTNAAFLATLSADLTGPQAPVFASDCRSSGRACPLPQLCCLACGYFGCDTYACFAPVNGGCPLFP